MAADARVSVFSVGDVFPDLPDGQASFAPLTPLFDTADIVFGNCEGVYSDRAGALAEPQALLRRARSRAASFLGEVGFDVMTLANNHMIDGGYDALADTIELASLGQGIATTGAGDNIVEATRPAILERNGIRVAFLGFCTVYPVGYEARESRPGLAPLRVRTYYGDPDPNFWEPGHRPRDRDGADGRRPRALPRDDRRGARARRLRRRRAALGLLELDGGAPGLRARARARRRRARRRRRHVLPPPQPARRRALPRQADLLRARHADPPLHDDQRRAPPIAPPATRASATRSSFAEDDDFPLFPFRIDARKSGVAVLDLAADGTIETGFIPAHMLRRRRDRAAARRRPARRRGRRLPRAAQRAERLLDALRARRARRLDVHEDQLMALVAVADAGSEPEAVMIVARLRDAGIAAMSKTTGPQAGRPVRLGRDADGLRRVRARSARPRGARRTPTSATTSWPSSPRRRAGSRAARRRSEQRRRETRQELPGQSVCSRVIR